MDERPPKEPMVRKEWLIAMAIVGASLLALVFVFCSSGKPG